MTARKPIIVTLVLIGIAAAIYALTLPQGRVHTDGENSANEQDAEDVTSPPSASPTVEPPAATSGFGTGESTNSTSIPQVAPSATVRGALPKGAGQTDSQAKRAQAREDRKKARAALEDFLRDDLRMSEEQLQAYKDIEAKRDAQVKAARDPKTPRNERREAIRGIIQDQTREFRELVGDVDYARIQDFQRRQREQYREEHPDSWDGRRGRQR